MNINLATNWSKSRTTFWATCLHHTNTYHEIHHIHNQAPLPSPAPTSQHPQVLSLASLHLFYLMRGSGYGAGTAQSVVCWARCPAWCNVMGVILPWASSRGGLSLRVNMGSDTIPPKSIAWEYKRDLVCAHMHCITHIQKILTFMF